jgi:hypothetical protein
VGGHLGGLKIISGGLQAELVWEKGKRKDYASSGDTPSMIKRRSRTTTTQPTLCKALPEQHLSHL